MASYKKYFMLGLSVFGIIFLLIVVGTIPSGSCIQKSTFEKENDNVYYSYNQLTNLLEELQSQYPDIFVYYSLGKTYEGRDIWLVKISDNVSVDEGESQVFFTGGMHGNELPGFQAVIYSIKAVVENYTAPYVDESLTNRIRNVVNHSELCFIPMVNPDGCEAVTRKNRRPNRCPFGRTIFRGVDLNRNFDYNWDDVDKHPFRYIFIPRSLEDIIFLIKTRTTTLFERSTVRYPFLDFGSIYDMGFYRGPYPFSENETRAIKTFVENHSVIIWVDYHIPGEVIHYPQPWKYTSPSDAPIFRSITENVSMINGYKILQKQSWLNVSGNHGHWAYQEHGIYAFTIELCKSIKQTYYPDKEEILKVCDTHLLVNLYLAERAITVSSCSR